MVAGTLRRMVGQVGNTGRAVRARLDGWRRARRALRELELGRNPDGSTVVLEYQSGRVVSRRPQIAPHQAPVVPFAYADVTWLERVIVLGGYNVQRYEQRSEHRSDDQYDLEVRLEGGILYVQRSEAAQSVRLIVPFAESTEFLGDERAQVVNELNHLSVCGRWALQDNEALFATTTLLAGAGITSAQLLSALRYTALDMSMAWAMLAQGPRAG